MSGAKGWPSLLALMEQPGHLLVIMRREQHPPPGCAEGLEIFSHGISWKVLAGWLLSWVRGQAMMGILVSPREDWASREGTWLKKDLGTPGKIQP